MPFFSSFFSMVTGLFESSVAAKTWIIRLYGAKAGEASLLKFFFQAVNVLNNLPSSVFTQSRDFRPSTTLKRGL
jgi:hypothetical protein